MSAQEYFRTRTGKKLKLPLFFPDATRAVVKSVDSTDIKSTHTPGVLVNTYHLYLETGKRVFKKFNGVRPFMNWDGACISDSGGFQVMSVIKSGAHEGKITDQGIHLRLGKKKRILFTPEKSIEFQFKLNTDLMVVLDDFTPPDASHKVAKRTVERTINWAARSKHEFETQCKAQKLGNNKPYLIGVVQGGEYLDLRTKCAKALVEIGFDGLGFGGWPLTPEGDFNYKVAKLIAKCAPKNYLLYGLGIGKPEEIAGCVKLGYHIFDCVLPTRDARHGRLYVYNAKKFYSFYTPTKQKYYYDKSPVSTACDCLLCTNYSRAYLAHLFRIKDPTALRLASIHNLRFYSLLMEKLRGSRS